MDRVVEELNIRKAEIGLAAAQRSGISQQALALWRQSIERMRARLDGRGYDQVLETAAIPSPGQQQLGRRGRADYPG